MEQDALTEALSRFGGSADERRAVARQARDLSDAGLVDRDRDHALTADVVLEELAEAPDGGPADRWNWWVGAMNVAYGGYEPFGVWRFER